MCRQKFNSTVCFLTVMALSVSGCSSSEKKTDGAAADTVPTEAAGTDAVPADSAEALATPPADAAQTPTDPAAAGADPLASADAPAATNPAAAPGATADATPPASSDPLATADAPAGADPLATTDAPALADAKVDPASATTTAQADPLAVPPATDPAATPPAADPALEAAAASAAPAATTVADTKKPSATAPEPSTPATTTASNSPSATSDSGEREDYTVRGTDTLMKLAYQVYGDLYQWKKIYEDNKDKIKDPNHLSAGTVLKLEKTPGREVASEPTGESYRIKKGDTLGTIANAVYGTASKWKALWEANKKLIKNPNQIFAGFSLYYSVTPEERAAAERHKQERSANAPAETSAQAEAPATAAIVREPVALQNPRSPQAAAAPSREVASQPPGGDAGRRQPASANPPGYHVPQIPLVLSPSVFQ